VRKINATEIIAKLSHDLRNDFAVIRAVAGVIKRKSPPSEMIDEKIETINEKVTQAMTRLDHVYALLKHSEAGK